MNLDLSLWYQLLIKALSSWLRHLVTYYGWLRCDLRADFAAVFTWLLFSSDVIQSLINLTFYIFILRIFVLFIAIFIEHWNVLLIIKIWFKIFRLSLSMMVLFLDDLLKLIKILVPWLIGLWKSHVVRIMILMLINYSIELIAIRRGFRPSLSLMLLNVYFILWLLLLLNLLLDS